MRLIKIGGKEMPVKFTTYTAKVMYELTGINIYNLSAIAEIFKTDEMTPNDFERFGKFVYAALAAGSMPDDADDNWKPSFSLTWVLNNLEIKDGGIITEITAAYLGVTTDDLKKESEKNLPAPKEGQKELVI